MQDATRAEPPVPTGTVDTTTDATVDAGAKPVAPEAVIVVGGRRTARPFALGRPGGARGSVPPSLLELPEEAPGGGWGGSWATVAFRHPGAGAASRVHLRALARTPTGPLRQTLPLTTRDGGLFDWTGRLPEGTTGLEVAPSPGETHLALDRFTVTRRGRAGLVARALLHRPDLALVASFWRLLGKRVRGRNHLTTALSDPTPAQRARRRFGRGLPTGRALTPYETWIIRYDTRDDADRARIRAEVAGWRAPPLISVVMPVYDPAPKVLREALRSLAAQLYPHWELCLADDASTDPEIPRLIARFAASEPRVRAMRREANGHIARATNDALALAKGPFVAFMDHDDALPETALYEVAKALIAEPDLDLVYSDEDKIDAAGRRFEPHFKSDWNLELLYAQNYVNHLTVVRTARVREVGGLRPGFEGSQDHDLLLRLAAVIPPARVRHIPRVLYHWRAAIGSGTFSDKALARAEAARLRALEEHVAGQGRPHRVERGPLGFNRLVRALPDPAPLVSVIIPTRDRADILAVTLDGLLARTDYPALDVIVLDNDSREPETAALFARLAGDPRVRVLSSPGTFNFSKLSNEGAAAARGSVLLFLNNDVEVLEPGWLRELASIAVEPEIGAVGAKLSYPDGTLQHGGVILGVGGVAGHSHLGISREDPGYFGRMVVAQEVSAVTGACLAMRRSVFEEVGRFDEEDFTVAFNDVDLCLRVRRAGYRIIWTPHAALTHHESKSRGREDTPEKRARFEREIATMLRRWGPELDRDPYYNPNLTKGIHNFHIEV